MRGAAVRPRRCRRPTPSSQRCAALPACGRRSRPSARKSASPLPTRRRMVCAGQLVMQAAARASGAEIIPVDSEHSAIFQCLMGCRDQREVQRLILTCSGGPFFGKSREELASVTQSGRPAPPQLEDGREDHHRLRHADEQGARGHRGHAAVRAAAGEGRRAVIHRQSRRPFAGGVRRRRGTGAAGRARYAHPHRPCHDVPEPAAQPGSRRSTCSPAAR